MANKSVPKRVKFEYFEVVQEVDEEALTNLIYTLENGTKDAETLKLISSLKEIQENLDSYSFRYDLEPLLDSVRTERIKQCITVVDKLVELDLSTFLPAPFEAKNNDVIFFQLTNCRDVNIPSKKKIGKDRENIELADDEYIGEFMSIIYHKTKCSVMVQLNKYALSVNQLEHFFSALRLQYLAFKRDINPADQIFKISLRPIIDNNALAKIGKQQDFTKFNIKCSDTSLMALAKNDKSALYKLSELTDIFQGVNIDITLSVDARQKKKDKKVVRLNSQAIKNVYESFQQIKDDKKPNITVNFRNGSKTDVLNWLIPKIQNEWTFNIEPRKTIGYEYMFDEMIALFRERMPAISTALGSVTIKRE